MGGVCSSGAGAHDLHEPQPKPIQVRPAADNGVTKRAAAATVEEARQEDGVDVNAAKHAKDVSGVELAAAPVPAAAAAAAHPFGLPLTAPELQALFPSHVPPPALSEEDTRLWRDRILPDTRAFRRDAAVEWNRIVVAHRVPPQFRMHVWNDALDVDKIHTPYTYRRVEKTRVWVLLRLSGDALASLSDSRFSLLLLPPLSSEYLLQSSPADSQISRDIYRTFSDHPFFTHKPVQRCIGRILHAWSLYNPVVSYVQGHNYLAALFLMVTLDEEQAWRCFLSFLAHPDHGMEQFYADGLKLPLAQCARLGALVQVRMPRLAKHLANLYIDPLMWATPFYLTAFTHHLTLDACVFVFDLLLTANLDATRLPHIAGDDDAVLPRSSIGIGITHLALALLEEQEASLLKLSAMDKVFQAIQQLPLLKQEKTRRQVFERTLFDPSRK